MNQALKIAVKAVDDKKGIDIVVLDISGVATFADHFLLCSGDSARQIQAIADEVPAHIEGYTNAEWVLLDYLDLVVHVFSKKSRGYYDLERLWRDAKALDVAKLLAEEESEASPAKRTRKRRLTKHSDE